MELRFTWDPVKAARNLRLHGISFETAKEVFSDPNQVISKNYYMEGEQRFGVIGLTLELVLVMTVFVDRSNSDAEVIHIISARKADSYERRAYEDQFG